jgi:hypothetical protein
MLLGLFVVLECLLGAEVLAAGHAVAGRLGVVGAALHLRRVLGHPAFEIFQRDRVQLGHLALQIVAGKAKTVISGLLILAIRNEDN